MFFRYANAAFTFATFPGLVAAATIEDTLVQRVGVPRTISGSSGSYRTEYGGVDSLRSALAVTVLPFVACSAFAATLLAVAVVAVPFWTLGWWMCSWFGLAVAVHALPDSDAALALGRASGDVEGAAGRLGAVLASAFRVSDALVLVRADALYASLLYYAVASALLPGSPGIAIPAVLG
ncbi:hypothetical protein [Halorarum salinum]|uniref:Uncharacterized protein n=1 Tax=Halorarum salinum TaxID=2743089 RepID=A0A7D5QBF9_9EURY|nr:hypothetical protein [Halobaculum salinum]QLG63117.1 hypothetical protein HUG12_15810 [Halobaculum salinum]